MKNVEDNLVVRKSYLFALRIVTLYQDVTKQTREYVISKQILRCGTSIGANIEEAIGAQSKRDFLAKMYISYKETRETRFWLRLLRDSKYIDSDMARSLLYDCEELARITGKILSTTKINLMKK